MKKKWSFRSISFSKKDKNKPAREEAPKNGDVTKEEPLAEVSKPSHFIVILFSQSSPFFSLPCLIREITSTNR